jgi:DNA repair exonuclease SbcCD nuclease subunit
MIKKVIHISDIHVRTLQMLDIYREQMEKFVDDIKVKYSQFDHNEIRIVITGDIFHQKLVISNEQILLVAWFFNELSKIGNVVIIPGNHDFLENNTERIDSITPIVDLVNNKNITYFKDSGVYDDDNVKWVVYSLYQHNVRPEFEKVNGFTYIGLFHGPIQGLTTDAGYTFDDAYDKINFRGLNVVLCGDIHKRQVLMQDDIQIIQIGSFLQQNFGETVKHHGYGEYDVTTNTYTFTDIENEHPFLEFKINDIKDIEDGTEIITNLG